MMTITRRTNLAPLIGAIGCLLALVSGALAQEPELSFRMKLYSFSGSATFNVELENTSRDVDIEGFELTIGNDDRNFDAAYNFSPSSDPSHTVVQPDEDWDGGERSDRIIITFGSFGPGETVRFRVDIDNNDTDVREVLFNNGSKPNAIASITGSNNETFNITLPDGAANNSEYTFQEGPIARNLTVISVVEANAAAGSQDEILVEKVDIDVAGNTVRSDIGRVENIRVFEGETVVISAPSEVYKDIHGDDLSEDIVANNPNVIEASAQERFTASGISVNDVPQTGDPTLYRFDMTQDAVVVVKWSQEYALLIDSNFDETVSPQKTSLPGATETEYWAGPLTSKAAGNPTPAAGRKHWIKKGEEPEILIEPVVLDFSHPGLDIRYVPTGFLAYGPPSPGATSANDEDRRINQVEDISTIGLTDNPLPFDEAATHLQIETQPMYGPGGVTFQWQIQFGVRVNIDDLGRVDLPRIYGVDGGALTEVGNSEGTFWFNPESRVRIAAPSNDPADPTKALMGWINGDGYYFESTGDINTTDGSLNVGVPSNGDWVEEFDGPNEGDGSFRGLEIPSLDRPSRVLWRYGTQAIALTVEIGDHAFKDHPDAMDFTSEPSAITQIAVAGNNQEVGDSDMAIWDPVASALFPVVPGTFRAEWHRDSDPDPDSKVNVIITAVYPAEPHYPHVIDTPPVSLDPDPDDDFLFKEVRYSENQAVVDGGNLFTAGTPGNTVLLFSVLRRVGRGEPHETYAVRVVGTKDWRDGLVEEAPVPIGQKISAPNSVDRANLGTGFIINPNGNARYNPYVYDAGKLDGIAAIDVYDIERLRSDAGEKVVVNKDALPGPIIPVNLHPGAGDEDRIVVAWYDDPAANDGLLWPEDTRLYLPRWPTAAEGLKRVVIASQFGSESLDAEGNDQATAPLVGELPEETTYNPSRLQAVQIYQQPDPDKPGYNPNEEHALMAPSLRFASGSPRPPAAFALRDGDLNTPPDLDNLAEGDATLDARTYTSHPFVLVQFFDTADEEFKMNVYTVAATDPNTNGIAALDGYHFANLSPAVIGSLNRLRNEPRVTMKAGEPVIPFYPLGVAIGASPCRETFGNNIRNQETYWEDHKGSSWAVSGDENSWFTASFFYPLSPDFWWPAGVATPPVRTTKNSDATTTASRDAERSDFVPQVGDCVAFLPEDVGDSTSSIDSHLPTRILYKSDWPSVLPVLKAGETVTFSGGEFRADHATMQIVNGEGELETVETPGMPQVLAFASAEVVFDTLNPTADSSLWPSSWTARVAQVLDKRTVALPLGSFPTEFQPANGATRVQQGKYIFNELPASLQKRVRYDPLSQFVDPDSGLTVTGKLEISGFVNDKDIGDPTLTASPPAVYVLEPNILTDEDVAALKALAKNVMDPARKSAWESAVEVLHSLSRNPNQLQQSAEPYLVGLEGQVVTNGAGEPNRIPIELGSDVLVVERDNTIPAPSRAFGPGLALLPNEGFLDPNGIIQSSGERFPEISYVTVAENNDPSLGGAPITLHVIKVDRRERYRGAIKTVLSDNVFDENIVLRHTGDFGANASDLVFEWWYRPDDGSTNVPPPDLLSPSQANPWKLFPDMSGNRGRGRYEVTLKGNPNAPEALIADTFWFARYRHENDNADGTDWDVPQADGADQVNFTWAGAGNSDPFNDFDLDGLPDFRAQLAQGWIKRVLDAVNPYEARIRDFDGDNPSTVSSMISQFGARFEGPVALNPSKNVIENVGLIELYETILKRGSDLTINLSRPVASPAIANALQLASTRISDFYTILGNEAFVDSLDHSIGFGSDSVQYGSLSPAVFAFQNQMPNLIGEELGLLRGLDDFFARPVYNRLFWNFTKGEGEAAYATNYNINDINQDGFIDEDDAMILYPQGHGDAWGHYLSALRNQYDLLKHPFFNWVSRSEFYNLQDIVIKVDFLDERKFAATAAAKAKTGADVVDMTYREKFVSDPESQWQGYTDNNPDRAWGVQGWSRRAGQGAYFDWVTANALLPSEHPNGELEGIQKVDRSTNSDIAVISANLNRIQRTFDEANKGQNPLGVDGNTVPFDIDPARTVRGSPVTATHFEQIYERAVKALENAVAIWDNANKTRNMLRRVGNSERDFRNKTFQEDLTYRNRLIKIFGRPYEGTIGPGRLYPAGYEGPDVALFNYVNVRVITDETVPGPSAGFAEFDGNELVGGDIEDAYGDLFSNVGVGLPFGQTDLSLGPLGSIRLVNIFFNDESQAQGLLDEFAPTFAPDSDRDGDAANIELRDQLYDVEYTDLASPKVELANLSQLMPITAEGYSFQAPTAWGGRLATGELQQTINKMLQKEAEIAKAIGAWDGLSGEIVRTIRILNARMDASNDIQTTNKGFQSTKFIYDALATGILGGLEIFNATKDTVTAAFGAGAGSIPKNLPTGGLAVSPGDALAPAAASFELAGATVSGGIGIGEAVLRSLKLVGDLAFQGAELAVQLSNDSIERELQKKEWLKELEDLVGDEPVKRIEVFRQIQALRELSDRYRSLLDEGIRLIDERQAFNKRVAAQTQRNRYQDMTFRVSRNHALQTYRDARDLAARYAFLAAKAYDYETNLDPSDPGSPQPLYSSIVRARGLGNFVNGEPRSGGGGISQSLHQLKTNYDALKGQLGFNNPQTETGKISLRTELMRILPKSDPGAAGGVTQPGDFPFPGRDADAAWREALEDARVTDLWQLPEFRYFCRPFADEADGGGNRVAQPGLVFEFESRILAGQNFFGRPLSGGDQAYDPSNFATKIRSVGVWFSDYESEDVLSDLAEAPRVYLVPVGTDVMTIPTSDPMEVRHWNVVDQRIPVPIPATTADLDDGGWIPLLDGLNGRFGDPRRFSSFRAYHNGSDAVVDDELVFDSRLVGRSIWNTRWMLIVPGQTLNADSEIGLERFIEQVSDIKLIFQTYGYSGG